MNNENQDMQTKQIVDSLKIDCRKCFGFCCTALYFSASDGFPADKEAGKPCIHLQQDFKCVVHKNLRQKGLKGCTIYDCFGAGQKVAQVTYKGQDWRQAPTSANQMFEAFLIMRQLHEMLWYLTEASVVKINNSINNKIGFLRNETEQLTHLDASNLIGLDIELHRNKVNAKLKKVSEWVRGRALNGQKSTLKSKKEIFGRLDFIGADLRKMNLRGADLRGALLVGANLKGMDLMGADFIGADLRDADLRGADLSEGLFVTQMQINAAKGDLNTRLPIKLIRPSYWEQ